MQQFDDTASDRRRGGQAGRLDAEQIHKTGHTPCCAGRSMIKIRETLQATWRCNNSDSLRSRTNGLTGWRKGIRLAA
jgi:hypothetical protein